MSQHHLAYLFNKKFARRKMVEWGEGGEKFEMREGKGKRI